MLKKSLSIVVLMLIASVSFGETKKAEEVVVPKETNEMKKEFDEMFVEFSYVQKGSLKAMNDPELIKAQAKYAKNLYDAFIAEGFSKEQALELVKVQLEGNGNVKANH